MTSRPFTAPHIASPMTEDSSVIVIDAADLEPANDNVDDGTSRGRARFPLGAFLGGFLLAGLMVALERMLVALA